MTPATAGERTEAVEPDDQTTETSCGVAGCAYTPTTLVTWVAPGTPDDEPGIAEGAFCDAHTDFMTWPWRDQL